MTIICINPGSGPVANSEEDLATENMKVFLVDCKHDGINVIRVPDQDYGEGRFAFMMSNGVRAHEIQMPGIPLDQVRYTGEDGKNIWHYPRLYVDGSSWVWKFAVLDSADVWREEKETI